MANKKTTKRAILASVIAMVLCLAMFVGTTYAWFTDSVTSTGNKIVAGTLKIDLEMKEPTADSSAYVSIKDSQAAIFDYDNWEPGFMDAKVLRISNKGSLALKWYAKFVSDYELSPLANVIQVYVNPSATDMTVNSQAEVKANWQHVGTVKDFVNTIETTTWGYLAPAVENRRDMNNADAYDGLNSEMYLGIALVMDTTAGNEYQDMSLAGDFDILILATQLTAEKDDFDTNYDQDAEFDNFVVRTVATEAQLVDAIGSEKEVPVVINLVEDIAITETVVVKGDVTINLAKGTLGDGNLTAMRTFRLSNDASLTINNLGNTDPIVVTGYGLVEFKDENGVAPEKASVTLNGGNYVASTDDGAMIRLRDKAGVQEHYEINVNDVTYTDKDAQGNLSGWIISTDNTDAIVNVAINNSKLSANVGCCLTGYGVALFNNVELTTNALGVEVSNIQATFQDCKFVTGDDTRDGIESASVWGSYGGQVTIIRCDFAGDAAYAYGLLPGSEDPDGCIIVTDCTGNDAMSFYNDTATGTIIVDGIEFTR